jgi:hypothetical protein
MWPNKLRTASVEYHGVRIEVKRYASTDSDVGRSISISDDSRNCNEIAGEYEEQNRLWP